MSRILNHEALTSHGHVEGRKLVLEILEAGLMAADPYHNTRRLVKRDGDTLTIGEDLFEVTGSPKMGDEVIDLRTVERIFLFGAGKGIQRVARALEDILGERVTGGCVIDKAGGTLELARTEVVWGAHPVPDAECARGCRRIRELASDLTERDLVFTMCGNGVSALLTQPAESISLEELRAMTYLMQIERGAPTKDLIPVRNHLDQMKGGQFSRYLQPARCIHLYAFHVPKSYQEMLHEPHFRWLHTLPDDTTYATAIASLKKWDAWEFVSEGIRNELLRQDRRGATFPVADFEKTNARTFFIMPEVLGMVPTAREKARQMGLDAHILFNGYKMTAEASQVGKVSSGVALTCHEINEPFQPPVVLISGGELIVTVGQDKGMGGRNQEYALAAALVIDGEGEIIMGSVDSDGTDGPGHQFVEGYGDIPQLTGGLIDSSTASRARELGVNLHDAIKRHDTSPALFKLDDGIIATPSMSMGDLSVTLIL